MIKTRAVKAFAASVAIALLASAPARAETRYEVSSASSGQASGPAATWSAHSDIDGSGGFSLDAAVDDPSWGAGGTRAVATVAAHTTKTVTLAPGQYLITAVISGLVGTLEEAEGADASITAALEAQCLNCITMRSTSDVATASGAPNSAVTPHARRTLYDDTRTVTGLLTVVDRSGPVGISLVLDAVVANGSALHRAGRGGVHISGVVESISIDQAASTVL